MLLMSKLEKQRRDAFDQLRADTEHAPQQPYAAEVHGRAVVDAMLEVNAGVYLPRVDRHGRVQRPKGVDPHRQIALLPLMSAAETANAAMMTAAVVGLDTLREIPASQGRFMTLEDTMTYPDLDTVLAMTDTANPRPSPHGAKFLAQTHQMAFRSLYGAQAVVVVANQMISQPTAAGIVGHEYSHALDFTVYPEHVRSEELRGISEIRATYVGAALHRAAHGSTDLGDDQVFCNALRHHTVPDVMQPFSHPDYIAAMEPVARNTTAK